VSINFEQQEIAQIHTFYDYCVQKQYFRYTCPCQIPAHEIIYDQKHYLILWEIWFLQVQILSWQDWWI